MEIVWTNGNDERKITYSANKTFRCLNTVSIKQIVWISYSFFDFSIFFVLPFNIEPHKYLKLSLHAQSFVRITKKHNRDRLINLKKHTGYTGEHTHTHTHANMFACFHFQWQLSAFNRIIILLYVWMCIASSLGDCKYCFISFSRAIAFID